MTPTAKPRSEIFDYLRYEPETGSFTWLKYAGGRSSVGKSAGYIDAEGYQRVSFRGVRYYGHSLAWLHETGEWIIGGIDHKNLLKSDNRYDNLRKATKSQNAINSIRSVKTSSKYKGVTWNAKNRKWQAQIKISGRQYYLGIFVEETDAALAYRDMAVKHHGEFARFPS